VNEGALDVSTEQPRASLLACAEYPPPPCMREVDAHVWQVVEELDDICVDTPNAARL
jgi:hypothetical protein